MAQTRTAPPWAAALLLLSPSTIAWAVEFRCPASITETPTVAVVDPAWTVSAPPGQRPLEQAGVYLGVESELGAQVPDSVKKAKGRETVSWRIVRSPGDAFRVGCSYVGTTAVLLRPIEPGLGQCTATYELLPSGRRQALRSFECR